jgi:hypothetical protein
VVGINSIIPSALAKYLEPESEPQKKLLLWLQQNVAAPPARTPQHCEHHICYANWQ